MLVSGDERSLFKVEAQLSVWYGLPQVVLIVNYCAFVALVLLRMRLCNDTVTAVDTDDDLLVNTGGLVDGAGPSSRRHDD